MILTRRARLLTGTAAALLATSLASGAAQAQTETADLTVTASVVDQCLLTGGTLNFGTYVSGQLEFKDGLTEITYDCASDIDITIALGSGLTPEADGSRNMAFGGDELNYQLYQDAGRSQVWGTDADALQIAPTPGGGAVLVPVYGRIFEEQEVAAGTYQDTVIITLTVNG